MAKHEQADRLEVVRMANGYMVKRASDYSKGDMICLQDCYVYNDWAQAAAKMVEMLGGDQK